MNIERTAAAAQTLPTDARKDLDERRLKEACQEFESFLNQHLLNSMSESIMRAEEPDQARETFEGMFRQTLAGELSRHSKGGLADLLYGQLAPLLEAKRESSTTSARPAASVK